MARAEAGAVIGSGLLLALGAREGVGCLAKGDECSVLEAGCLSSGPSAKAQFQSNWRQAMRSDRSSAFASLYP